MIANLGDSRAVLGTIGEDEIMAVQLTTDLKPSVPSKKLFLQLRKFLGYLLVYFMFRLYLVLSNSIVIGFTKQLTSRKDKISLIFIRLLTFRIFGAFRSSNRTKYG